MKTVLLALMLAACGSESTDWSATDPVPVSSAAPDAADAAGRPLPLGAACNSWDTCAAGTACFQFNDHGTLQQGLCSPFCDNNEQCWLMGPGRDTGCCWPSDGRRPAVCGTNVRTPNQLGAGMCWAP